MEDAKGLGRALSNYTDEYFTQVLLGFVVIYILYPFNVACLFNLKIKENWSDFDFSDLNQLIFFAIITLYFS